MTKAKIATLLVEVAAETAQIRKEMAAASKSVDRFAKNTDKSLKAIDARFMAVGKSLKAGIAGLAVGAASAISTDAIKRTFEWANALQDTADKIGLGTEALQELTQVNAQFGVSAKATETAMQRFSRRIGEAAVGTGELKGTLQQYNIELRNSDGSMRSLEAIYSDYADAVANAGTEQEKLRMAVKAFDTEGAGLVNVLRQGSAAIGDMRNEARQLGGVLDAEMIAKAAEANTRFDALTDRLGSQLRGAIISLTPVIYAAGAAIEFIASAAGTALEPINALIDSFTSIETAELSTLQSKLEQLQAARQSTMTGPGALGSTSERALLDDQIARVEARIAELTAAKAAMQAISAPAPALDAPTPGPPPKSTADIPERLEADIEGGAGAITERLVAHRDLLKSYDREIAMQSSLSAAARESYRLRQQENELFTQREQMLEAGIEVSVVNEQIAALKEKQQALNAIEQSDAVKATIADLRTEAGIIRQNISLLGEDEFTRKAIIGAQEEILYLQERYGALLPEQVEQIKAAYNEIADVERVKANIEELQATGEEMGRAIAESVTGLVQGTQTWTEALKSLETQLLSILTQKWFVDPFSEAFGNAFAGIGGFGADVFGFGRQAMGVGAFGQGGMALGGAFGEGGMASAGQFGMPANQNGFGGGQFGTGLPGFDTGFGGGEGGGLGDAAAKAAESAEIITQTIDKISDLGDTTDILTQAFTANEAQSLLQTEGLISNVAEMAAGTAAEIADTTAVATGTSAKAAETSMVTGATSAITALTAATWSAVAALQMMSATAGFGGGGLLGGFGVFHAGGRVSGDLGRMAGLAADERMAILQTGEYVLSRDMIKALGGMPKFHDGGPVGDSDFYSKAPEWGDMNRGPAALFDSVGRQISAAGNDNRTYDNSNTSNVFNFNITGMDAGNSDHVRRTMRQAAERMTRMQQANGRLV